MDVKLFNDKYEELIEDMISLIPDENIDKIIYRLLEEAKIDIDKIYSEWNNEKKILFYSIWCRIRGNFYIFIAKSNNVIKDEKKSSFLNFIISSEALIKKYFEFDYCKDIEVSYEENKDRINPIEKLLIFIIINLKKLNECILLIKKGSLRESLRKKIGLLKRIGITFYYERGNGNSTTLERYLYLPADEMDIVKVLKIFNKDFCY
jgi:hypothetical protein